MEEAAVPNIALFADVVPEATEAGCPVPVLFEAIETIFCCTWSRTLAVSRGSVTPSARAAPKSDAISRCRPVVVGLSPLFDISGCAPKKKKKRGGEET